MKKYNEYIDVGLPWYPHGIPSHWSLVRHKNVLIEHKELVGENSANYTLLSLTLNGVIIRDISEGKGKFAKDYDKYVVVDEGDFVFCLFDVEETPRTVGLSKHRGMITGAYDVFKPHGINPEYFYYYYLALDNVKALKPLYSGLRKVIPYPSFMAMKVPVPPKEEQDQIVRYLDWKVSNINRLIHGYQRQIKLLEEQKKNTIYKAVTFGFNTDRNFKIIECIGKKRIPNDWAVVPLCSIAKEKSICNCTDLELLSVYLDEGVVKFSSRSEKRTNTTSKDLSKYQRVDPGDFVLNNQQAWRGSVGVSDYTGIISPAYIVLSLDDVLIRKYANYLFRSAFMIDQFLVVSKGVGSIQRNIYWPSFKRSLVIIPPKSEQQEIVDYIDVRCKEINVMIDKVNLQIEHLKEYRTRLISDVVTGQVDVRGVEIPDYTPEEDNAMDEEINDTEEVTDSAD